MKNNAELKGYYYADGVHWYYKGQEIAVIDELTNEIEWCIRKHNLPSDVVEAVRNKRYYPDGKWVIEVKKYSYSATQGEYHVFINGKELITFGSKIKLNSDGRYDFDIPDSELGRLVVSAFWHKYDDMYHYSDKAKDVFDPKWRTR